MNQPYFVRIIAGLLISECVRMNGRLIGRGHHIEAKQKTIFFFHVELDLMNTSYHCLWEWACECGCVSVWKKSNANDLEPISIFLSASTRTLKFANINTDSSFNIFSFARLDSFVFEIRRLGGPHDLCVVYINGMDIRNMSCWNSFLAYIPRR